ncbi:MAG: hypothetical protein WCY92_09245 [Novosphingobium sp.]
MMPIRYAAFLLVPLALTACSSKPAEEASEKEKAESEIAPPPSPVGEAPASQDGASEIPVSIQGRWGLVSAGCTSTRGDAKGLLVIAPAKLTFYESVGTLGAVKERTDNRIRASFSFTGEGMEWTREMVLETENDGKSLVRQEFGHDAMPGPLKYARCP